MFQIVQSSQQAPPAAVVVRALSWMELSEMARRLTSAILDRRGWILNCSAEGGRELSLLFEFECEAALDMYVALVSCGLALSRQAHMDLTRLWHCAHNRGDSPCLRIARIALTAFAPDAQQVQVSCAG